MINSLPTRSAVLAMLSLCVSANLFAQTPPQDPWKHAPEFPTTCYLEDDFDKRLDAASTSLKADIERQKKVNDEAKQRFDNMEMSEKAQRMQAYMMKNPQAAAKLMEAQSAAGAAVAEVTPEMQATVGRLGGELQQLKKNFESAAEQSVKPAQARQQQFIETKASGVNNAWFTNAADHAQYVQLVAEENAAYEKACVPYFGAGGSFHKWLSRYRTEIAEKTIALSEHDATTAMLEAMGLPGGGYRSTAPLEEVDRYLNYQVRQVFNLRKWKAKPAVELRRD